MTSIVVILNDIRELQIFFSKLSLFGSSILKCNKPKLAQIHIT